MAEFDPDSAIEHQGSVVGGISLSEEELDEIPLHEISFANQYTNNHKLMHNFTEGTLLKIELDIEDDDRPDVEERIYEHTYDDIETQLNQIFKYRRKHRPPSKPYSSKPPVRKSPNEENCVIGIIEKLKEEKVIFNLHGISGSIMIRPHQLEAVYPCSDEDLSVHLDIHEEVIAYII